MPDHNMYTKFYYMFILWQYESFNIFISMNFANIFIKPQIANAGLNYFSCLCIIYAYSI